MVDTFFSVACSWLLTAASAVSAGVDFAPGGGCELGCEGSELGSELVTEFGFEGGSDEGSDVGSDVGSEFGGELFPDGGPSDPEPGSEPDPTCPCDFPSSSSESSPSQRDNDVSIVWLCWPRVFALTVVFPSVPMMRVVVFRTEQFGYVHL